MNLDDLSREVRDSLLANAESAPDGAGMVDAVRARSRRVQLRHRAGVASVAAAVAVAVAVGTPYLLTSRNGRSPVGPAAPNGSSAAAAATPTTTASSPPSAASRPTRVPLGPATFTPVAFPMDPTYTPAGLPAPTEGKTVGAVRLVYTAASGTKGIIATVDVDRPTVDASGATHKSTTVNGHPATIYTGSIDGAPGVLIVWQLHGKWVSVQGSGLSSAQVQQFAKGLADRPHRAQALPFTLALAPRGYQVAFQEIHPELSPAEFYVNLSAPGQMDNQTTDDAVGVIGRANLAGQAKGDPITVNGYPAKINRDVDGQVYVYVLRPGFAYAVHEPQNGPLSDEDLIRFAAGVAPRS